MKKVVLAIDSFKGCLSSIEADKTAEQGIKIVCSDIVKSVEPQQAPPVHLQNI